MRGIRTSLRFVASLLALALVVFVCADPVRAQVTLVGGGGASVSANNDWTGTNNFTSTVSVYQTTTHTGNNHLDLAHNGTDGVISVAAGGIQFLIAGGGTGMALNSSSGGTTLGATHCYGWASGSNPTGATAKDTCVSRVAAAVVGPNSGWLQNTAGRVRLSGDYTNSTATFSNTALSFNVTTGRVYSFVAYLYLTESTAAEGVKLDFNGGSATSTNFVATCNLTNAVGAILTQTNATTAALATVINIAATTDANVHLYTCSGTFEPSSTSTFIIRAAQNSHSTGTLTIKRGSFAYMEDMP